MVLASLLAYTGLMPATGQTRPVAEAPPDFGAPPAPRLGAFLLELGGLANPQGAVYDAGGRLFVADSGNDRIAVFDGDGELERAIGRRGTGRGELRRPQGVALAGDGVLFVADTGNDRIQQFSTAGEPISVWGARGGRDGELCGPVALALHGEYVYVVDAGNHRIQVLGRDGRFVRAFGNDAGDADRRLNHPSDIAIDGTGAVYVADRENQRVQAYDRDGVWRRAWGSYGYHPGLFASAAGVATGAGLVFVADAMNHRIQAFRPDGELVYAWGRHVAIPHEGQGRLHYPARIALSPDGARAAVVETFENRVQVFGVLGPEDRDDGRVGGSAETGTLAHYGQRIAAHGKRIVVTEPESHALLVFDTSRPEPIHIGRWGTYGRKFGEFGTPTALAWETRGDALVAAELAQARLQTFRIGPESEKIGFSPTLARFSRAIELASLTAPADWPLRATAMRFDAAGNLYVLDARNARVCVFDREFKLVRAWGAHGDAAGALREPTDLAVVDDGSRVSVVDAGHRRVLCFDANGAVVATAPAGENDAAALVDPFGVAIGADGAIYVSDAGADCIRVFTRDGVELRRWGRRGLGAGEFFKPAGLAFDRLGRLFVVDWGNHRLQSFTPAGEFVSMFGARLYTQAARRRAPVGGD